LTALTFSALPASGGSGLIWLIAIPAGVVFGLILLYRAQK